nr:unnamed protein product [Callosobruchus chinensis]
MEKRANQELLKYLELHQLINDTKYGDRHQRSTVDLLAYVTHVWSKLIHLFGEAHVVALDISKAFDQLWHVSFPNKLPVELCNCTTIPILSFADDSTQHADIMSNRPIYLIGIERRRLASFSIKGSRGHYRLGIKNMVEFRSSKAQYCTLSNKRCSSEHSVLMNNQALPRSHSFRLSGEVFLAIQAQIRPSLEYCSHICGAAAPSTLSILDSVQRRAIQLIGDLALTCHLQLLSHRHAVALRVLYYHLRHWYGIDETPVLPYAPGDIESVVENERCRIYLN